MIVSMVLFSCTERSDGSAPVGGAAATRAKYRGDAEKFKLPPRLADYCLNRLDGHLHHFPLGITSRIVGRESDSGDFHLVAKRLQ